MQTTLILENPKSAFKTIGHDLLIVIIASLLICLSGQISIPLWFTPVPIATQNSIVLLIAALLGARRGSAAVFLFLMQGALGLPVFSNGQGGFLHFFGPRGGYLIGYLIAAFLVGYLMERKKNPILTFALGNLTIYLFGASYLATFVGIPKAFLLGIAPFLLGDLLKSLVSLKILAWKSS